MIYTQKIRRLLIASTILLSHLLYSQLTQADSIEVHHPRVNPTVEGITVTGMYFDLLNGTHKNIKLTKVTGEISDRIEIHEHITVESMMRMRRVDNGIPLPADKMVIFKPHGYHIMIMGLTKAIDEGDIVEVTLHFDDGQTKDVAAKAMKPAQKKVQHNHGY
jgi:copper(I)-binding protein